MLITSSGATLTRATCEQPRRAPRTHLRTRGRVTQRHGNQRCDSAALCICWPRMRHMGVRLGDRVWREAEGASGGRAVDPTVGVRHAVRHIQRYLPPGASVHTAPCRGSLWRCRAAKRPVYASMRSYEHQLLFLICVSTPQCTACSGSLLGTGYGGMPHRSGCLLTC